MAEPKGKYAAALAAIHLPPEEVQAEAASAPVALVEEQRRSRGRPAGKRSDPEWKLYSHFLKKQTQRAATNILRNEDNGQDLSDLLQQLLEQWVAQQETP